MIRIDLSPDELNALTALLDAGVKALGMQAVKPAAVLLIKLESAVAAANSQQGERQ